VGPNDLISVPANVKHWFDAGEYPNIKAVRFFTEKDGWEAKYTNVTNETIINISIKP
jgi:1,2-dihydroxy-3-keto-5-methylthiopentene dioxygenase